ncbi:MAG: sulfatase-like hydrolase/transferase [Planctomycetota bacterium]
MNVYRILSCMTLSVLFVAPALAADRPNVVWIVSEDNSKHYMELFDAAGAPTPNIEKLAEHGLIFERAFSNSPVCSVARTTLATSVYAPRLGTQFHRKINAVTLPDGWRLFHEYLRDAGYYVTNNAKTDYNVAVSPKQSWNESSRKATWRRRPSDETPFFHMESHAISHESRLHFSKKVFENEETRTDPASVTLWPYFPDTELFRYTTARYHDRIKDVDDIVGQTVAKLREDGLLDDTFIFYFGDHGGVLPGSKGYAWERGVHVPLVVYVPKNFRHLLDEAMSPATRVKGFVEFVDFGPTLLHLAGVDVPEHMDGKPFLGQDITLKQLNQRDEAFSHADRFDEKYEMVRGLRKGKWKYMRFFQGYYPDGLQNNYRYKMLAYEQWRRLYREGALNALQRQFFEPKPAEALYDVEADPHELHNLADDPRHAETLVELRERLGRRMRAMPDLSYYPESFLVENALRQPSRFGREHRDEIARLADIADLGTLPFDQARPGLEKALQSDKRWDRYWAMTLCATFGPTAKPLAEKARKLLKDDEPLVRVRAAEFLGRIRAADPMPPLMDVLKTSDSYPTAAIAMNTVVYLRDALGYECDISKEDVKATGGYVKRRLEYLAP